MLNPVNNENLIATNQSIAAKIVSFVDQKIIQYVKPIFNFLSPVIGLGLAYSAYVLYQDGQIANAIAIASLAVMTIAYVVGLCSGNPSAKMEEKLIKDMEEKLAKKGTSKDTEDEAMKVMFEAKEGTIVWRKDEAARMFHLMQKMSGDKCSKVVIPFDKISYIDHFISDSMGKAFEIFGSTEIIKLKSIDLIIEKKKAKILEAFPQCLLDALGGVDKVLGFPESDKLQGNFKLTEAKGPVTLHWMDDKSPCLIFCMKNIGMKSKDFHPDTKELHIEYLWKKDGIWATPSFNVGIKFELNGHTCDINNEKWPFICNKIKRLINNESIGCLKAYAKSLDILKDSYLSGEELNKYKEQYKSFYETKPTKDSGYSLVAADIDLAFEMKKAKIFSNFPEGLLNALGGIDEVLKLPEKVKLNGDFKLEEAAGPITIHWRDDGKPVLVFCLENIKTKKKKIEYLKQSDSGWNFPSTNEATQTVIGCRYGSGLVTNDENKEWPFIYDKIKRLKAGKSIGDLRQYSEERSKGIDDEKIEDEEDFFIEDIDPSRKLIYGRNQKLTSSNAPDSYLKGDQLNEYLDVVHTLFYETMPTEDSGYRLVAPNYS